ncbi:MAG TPA: endonuclease V [Myxococcota bacterium]|jgi:deoxyribonuclease V
MIVCLDVHYGVASTNTALVGVHAWGDGVPALELTHIDEGAAAAYEPGQFYARELPYLLAMLARVTASIDVVVVDGYAWLAPGRPGLGAKLREVRKEPVVGVAKTRFHGAVAVEVLRGTSASPLFVTADGIDDDVAAAHVAAMHGPYRMPTILTRVDALARALASSAKAR